MDKVKLRIALRQRRRIISSFFTVGALGLLGVFYDYCLRHGACTGSKDDQNFILELLVFAIAVLLIPWFLISALLSRRRNTRERTIGGFRYCPWQFDRKDIALVVRVERVFDSKFREILRKKLVDLKRRIAQDNDPSGRYLHQRFLVTSPLLKSGCRMLVLHNTSFGRLRLRKGVWLRVQGQYLHARGREWGWFGSHLAFYGKLHRTHEPHGFVEILQGKPVLSEKAEVHVVGPGSEQSPRSHGSTT